MKTRRDRKARKVKLHGKEPPPWFKDQSDGCSVPTRTMRFLLRARHARDICYRHDFAYYLIALQWLCGQGKWVGYRLTADFNLKQNLKLIAHNRFMGWIYSRLYFRGTRIGGRYAMKDLSELVMPPTPEALEQLGQYLHTPMTEQARDKIAEWKKQFEAG